MSSTNLEKPTTTAGLLTNAKDSVVSFLKDTQMSLNKKADWNAIKKLTRNNLELAKAHERNKISVGHPFYVKLNNEVQIVISNYCLTYDVDNTDVQVQLPALQVLNRLAEAPAQKTSAGPGLTLSVAVTIILVIISFLTGALSAVSHVSYNWITQLLR
jgi:hypothetical protein